MNRRPRTRLQFRQRLRHGQGRNPKVVRFETRGEKKKRRIHTLQLACGAILASTAIGMTSLWIWPAGHGPGEPPAGLLTGHDPDQPSMDLCSGDRRHSCVVDGDTIWFVGEKIRIADIDTPEVSEPGCAAEYRLGMRATYRLRDLLNQGPWSITPAGNRDRDDYGRSLRVLTRNGQPIGDMLVQEGLARKWTGRREPWC